jgi:hypothetical protein
MKRVWETPWLPAALLLGCGVLGWLAIRQRTELIRVDLEFKAEDKTARNQVADLRQQLAAVQAAQLRAEKLVAQTAQSPSGDGEVRTIHESDIVKDHPEYAAILAKQARRNVIIQYGPGLATLNLRPDQLAKLKDLLVERSQTDSDARQAATAAGLEQNSPAYWNAIKQATDVVDQEMTSVFGTDGAAAFQKLQNAANNQNQIRYNYASDFEDAGVALTPDQTQGLAQALAGARSFDGVPAADRRNYYQTDPATGLAPYENRMLEAAAQVLSPAQLQILKTDRIRSNKESSIMSPYIQAARNGSTGSVNIQIEQ